VQLKRLALLATIGSLLFGLTADTVLAASASSTQAEKGLLITPVRNEIKVDAGKVASNTVVVANLTDKTQTVTLQPKSFSVTELTYDYRFSNPSHPWVKLSQSQVTLASGQSKTIPYALSPELQATPGGYYFLIVASTTINNGGLPSTLEAASLLYVTINGKLVQSGEIEDIQAPKVVFGKQFDVSIDARNTGNVYYFASIVGHVKGLLSNKAPATTTNHLLIPEKTRRVSSSIQSPPLPGIYPIDVSYRTDTGTTVQASRLALFIPPWSIAALIGILLIVSGLRRRHDDKKPPLEP
jgi:uncharacterized membrane protein